MTKDVLVSVKGTQYMDGESDTVEVITAGTCHEKNGKWYVMYEETTEGVKEVTRNTVKIHPEKVEVKKGSDRGTSDLRTGKTVHDSL